eukprot:m51a1_g2252 putative nuclear pore complex protein (1331) ;mRNA; f:303305-307714
MFSGSALLPPTAGGDCRVITLAADPSAASGAAFMPGASLTTDAAHALSTGLPDATGSLDLGHGRVLLWHSASADALELREVSSRCALRAGRVLLRVPGLRTARAALDASGAAVAVWVGTSSGLVRRALLAVPPEASPESALAGVSAEAFMTPGSLCELPNRSPRTPLISLDARDATTAVAAAFSASFRVDLSPDRAPSEHELRDGAALPLLRFSLWGASAQRCHVAAAFVPGGPYALTVSSDMRVRAWDVPLRDGGASVVGSCDVKFEADGVNPLRQLLRVTRGRVANEFYAAVCAHVHPTPTSVHTCAVVVLRGETSVTRGQPVQLAVVRSAVVPSELGHSLVDCAISEDRLWLLLETNGESGNPRILTTSVLPAEGAVSHAVEWEEVDVFGQPPEMEVSQDLAPEDARNSVLSWLLEPGRFSPAVLNAVADELFMQPGGTPAERVQAALEAAGDSDPFNALSNAVEAARNAWNEEHAPLGLVTFPGVRGSVVLFTKAEAQLVTPAEEKGESWVERAAADVCHSVERATLETALGFSNAGSVEDTMLAALDLCADIFERPSLTGLATVVRPPIGVDVVADLNAATSRALAVLKLGVQDVQMNDQQSADVAASVFRGGFGATSVCQEVTRTLRSSFEDARALVVLVCSMIHLRQKCGLGPSLLADIRTQVLQNLLEGMHALRAAVWATTLRLEEPTANKSRDLLVPMATMTISGRDVTGGKNVWLLEVFLSTIADGLRIEVPAETTKWDLIPAFARAVLGTLNFGSSDKATEFASFLLEARQYSAVVRFRELVDPATAVASLVHMEGEACLSMGEGDVARKRFHLAARGVERGDAFLTRWANERSALEQLRQPESGSPGTIARYWIRCSELFGQCNMHTLALECSLDALAEMGEYEGDDALLLLVADTWSSVFAHALEIPDYDKAFEAICANPNAQRRADCVHSFVAKAVREGKAVEIINRTWPTSASVVTVALRDNARTENVSSIEAQSGSLSYYDALYSWHVSRGNHRAAALTMLELAQRLQRETHSSDIVSLHRHLQACYAALNSLRLARAPWVAAIEDEPARRTTSSPSVPESPKRPHSADDPPMYVPEDPVTQGVMSIEDVERMCLMAHARVTLAQRSRAAATAASTPDDAIARLATEKLYDEAATLSIAHGRGLTVVVRAMAQDCALGGPRTVAEDPFDEAADSWDALRRLLEVHGTADDYYEAAATVLRLKRDSALPDWLLRFLRERSVSSLTRLLLTNQLDVLAATVILQCITSARQSFVHDPVGGALVMLPTTSIDNVLQRLRQTSSLDQGLRAKYESLAEAIQAELDAYFTLVSQPYPSK